MNQYLNTKPNLWTLLCLGILVFYGISQFSGDNDCIPTKECGSIPDYKLTPEEAQEYLEKYEEYLNQEIEVVNPDVRYFYLPRCEMAEMLKDVGAEADVKAHLAVKSEQNENGAITNAIVLVFEDYLPSTTPSWFDFTTPCPNVCNF